MRYVIIQDQLVIDVVPNATDGYTPPIGAFALAHETAQVGWLYAAGVIGPPQTSDAGATGVDQYIEPVSKAQAEALETALETAKPVEAEVIEPADVSGDV